MDVIQEKLGKVRFEHQVWMNELIFALKEIEIYENRLLHLLELYTSTEAETELEILLNEFDITRKSIQKMQHQIKEHLKSMQVKINANGHLPAILDSFHLETQEEMKNFRKNFTELKERFNQFGVVQGGKETGRE